VVYGFVRADRGRRLLIAGSLALSAGYLAVPLMLRGTENFLDRGDFNLNGSRYMLLPILFLTVAMLLAFGSRDPRLSPRAWRNVQFGSRPSWPPSCSPTSRSTPFAAPGRSGRTR